jgi:hypothetical protein
MRSHVMPQSQTKGLSLSARCLSQGLERELREYVDRACLSGKLVYLFCCEK